MNYNFDREHLKFSFEEIFESARRDSCFAAVYKRGHKIIAIRDHLGTAPLFYVNKGKDIKFSMNLPELVGPQSIVSREGLLFYLYFGTVKLVSLYEQIKIVPPGSVLEIDLNANEEKIVYQYRFREKPVLNLNKSELVKKFDKLFFDAVKRTVREREVGLYLSGGMDSALVGIYLRKLGIQVNAYTSLPWGIKGTEGNFAKINGRIIGAKNHEMVPLETDQYEKLAEESLKLYVNPHGLSSSIGITDLWAKTNLIREKQIYGAQNADTAICSMESQSYSFFLSWLPKVLKSRVSDFFVGDTAVQDYISFLSRGQIKNYDFLDEILKEGNRVIFDLTLAGMYLCHTPADGEELSLPAINKNIIFSNPFYDIDLIEFCLKIPLKYRLGLNRKSKIFIGLEKNIFRELALRYLPRELVFRKKGLTVPSNRDKNAICFFEKMPNGYADVRLESGEARFAAFILSEWGKINGFN